MKPFPKMLALLMLAVTFAVCAAVTPIDSQSSTTPDWQTVAGGKIAFDVASVKQNKSGPPPIGDPPKSNVPLGLGSVYPPNGGLFSAINYPLINYIIFAYRLTANQIDILVSQGPKWIVRDRFDIQARAAGNPSKDQMRLMMQAVLVDRFGLSVHTEARQLPAFALVLVKPGNLGPQLHIHGDDSSCPSSVATAVATPLPLVTPAEKLTTVCKSVVSVPPSAPGRVRLAGRDVSLTAVTSSLGTAVTGLGRPILEETGLNQSVDFSLEWAPQVVGNPPPGEGFQPDPSAPTFLEALKEQLGLKLEARTSPVEVFVIDHIEEPSEN
jgi:uncharacterized protein (TIGR03435 family)